MRFIDADALLRMLAGIYAFKGWNLREVHFSYLDIESNIENLNAIIPRVKTVPPLKEQMTMVNVHNIQPDGQTIVVEHQATGEQPVHVTPEGVQTGDLTGAPAGGRGMKIGWFPYDAVKPRENGHYLITARQDGCLYVTTDDFYSYGWDDWGNDVIAWAELPEPYREAEENE